ncbi:putative snare domain-containing protein [Ilyonectria robusta]
MSTPSQLFLLSDHIKLSLLERKRAQSLNLEDDTQDGHISRSLDQFRDGVASLGDERQRLADAGDATYVVPPPQAWLWGIAYLSSAFPIR